MSELYAFARGPLFLATFLFMVLGLLRLVVLRTRDLLVVRSRTPKRDVPWRAWFRSSAGWAVPVRHVLTEVPILSVASVSFHIGLLVTPIFLARHVVLLEGTISLPLPTLPALVADGLTLLTIGAGVVLLGVRILRRPARILSRPTDYLLLLILLTPFVSGYLAVHPTGVPISWDALMLIHVLSAELVFVLAPTTKLSHMVLFPFARLSGEIFWRLVPGAGDRVAITLRGDRKGAEA